MMVASFSTKEWIDPWRDRRPMTDDAVLVTTYWHGVWSHGVAYYDLEGEDWYGVCGTILAWMPLPEVYNPVEEIVIKWNTRKDTD